MAEQKKRDAERINVGVRPAAPLAIASLTNPAGRTSRPPPAAADGTPTVNVGFGQSRPVDMSTPRKTPLGVRLLRGDFQMRRPQAGAPDKAINVGMGGATADSPRTPQRTLDPAAPAPRPAARPAAPPKNAAPPGMPALAAAPVAVPPQVAAATPPAATSPAALQPGDMNTFTGSNGVTRRIEPAASSAAPAAATPAGPTPIAAPGTNAPGVQQAVVRALDANRGQVRAARADAAEVLNPMSNGAELVRRLENSQNSYFHKGSPSARRAMAEAYLGQLGTQNAASLQGLRSAGDTLERGVGFEAAAMEGASRRQFDADTFNADAGYRERALTAEQQRPTGTVIRGLDGNTSMVRNDGSVSTLRDEAGNPIQTPEPATSGALTPAALLEAYSQQAQAINEGLGTPEEKSQQQAALRSDPIFSALFQQQQASIPSGTVRGGYRFKGGDPAQQSNWEKVK